MMKTIGEFIKTTMIGGLLIVVPTYLAVLLLVKAIGGIAALLAPIVALLPGDPRHGRLIAVALVVLLCFLLGVAARTGPGKRAIDMFEQRVLKRMPGFELLRAVVSRLSGSSEDDQFQPVLVEIEDALTPAFIVEEIEGDQFVVLVPSVPTPAAGSLYILPRERVHWVDASMAEVVGVITRWGAGTGKLVKAMRRETTAIGGGIP